MNEIIALGIFLLVYFLIIVRTRLNNLPFWVIMSIGAILVLGFGIIPIESALKSINFQVIAFLFGMFSITSALERSGVINHIVGTILSRIKNVEYIILVIVCMSGFLAAFVVNDTAAIILIPFAISLSNQLGVKPSIVLISIAIGINVGSTMTPIGSPQNLLIASQSGMALPFLTFLSILGPPTIINLFLSGLVLHLYYKKDIGTKDQYTKNGDKHINEGNRVNYYEISNNLRPTQFLFTNRFPKISVIVFLSTIGAIILSEVTNLLFGLYIDISIISLIGAAVLYILCKERISIVRDVKYSVLIFFIGMFIFTSALWTSGLIPNMLDYIPPFSLDNTYYETDNILYNNAIISVVSITMSQILSNVPFVAIYNLFMIDNGFDKDDVSAWLMLAAASTIAGNLTIFGAASNIIIMQNAESRGMKVFTFIEFFKIGSLITALNIIIYYLFLVFHDF
ncbi:MAG TPA: SLC13 family permease [Candidatus Nitrosocosmicus sp.]|nr:SLC13 family permease [Candidatus Nitrosocosmicus sp.]